MSELYKILGKAGSDSIFFAHKASLLLDDNMIDDALNLCELGVKKFPAYAEGHYVLGRCYQAFERFDDAKNEFERALYFSPGHVRALGALAYVYYKKKLKKLGNTYLLKNAVFEPNNRELVEYLESQNLYQQLFKSPIIDEQLSADLDGFLPSEEEKQNLQERVDQTFKTSDETKRILKKDQVDLAKESYKNQDKIEVQNIMDRLGEDDTTKTHIDLSQYANVDDDFSTLMGDFLSGDEKEETVEEKPVEELAEPAAVKEHQDPPEEETAEPAPETPEVHLPGEEQDQLNPPTPGVPEEHEPQAFPEPEAGEVEEMVSKNDNDKDESQEQNAFSDLLLTQEPSKSDEMPAFDTEDLDAVSMSEDNQEGTEEEIQPAEEPVFKEEEPEQSEPDLPTPEPPAKEPQQEEDLIFTKKRVEAETTPPESLSEDDKTASIEEIMSNPSLVTPTFGEILISQRKFSEARHVFLKLWERHPDNPRFKEKVEFLDKLIKLQS